MWTWFLLTWTLFIFTLFNESLYRKEQWFARWVASQGYKLYRMINPATNTTTPPVAINADVSQTATTKKSTRKTSTSTDSSEHLKKILQEARDQPETLLPIVPPPVEPSHPHEKSLERTKRRVAAKQKWKCLTCDSLLTSNYHLEYIVPPLSRAPSSLLDEKNMKVVCSAVTCRRRDLQVYFPP